MDIESVLQGRRIDAVDESKRILNLSNALTDANRDIPGELVFEVLSGGEVIRMSMRLAASFMSVLRRRM